MDLKGAEIRNVKNLCSEMGSKENVPMRVNIPYYQDLINGEKII